MNYTRAAEMMNMSQPAVSNHISYLEDQLNVKLFIYKNKTLFLTDEGKYLFDKLQFMINYSNKTLTELGTMDYTIINLGCTLSISDYMIPSFVVNMIKSEKKIRLNMGVENTEILLSSLAEGKIDGAFIEGDFNQNVFSSIPYKEATIIGICAPDFELADKKVSFSDLFDQRLIMREAGSGTRSSFETVLAEYQIETNSFKNQTTLGSIDLIKRVVEANVGISFLFDVCVEKELKEGTLKQLKFDEKFSKKVMNFVYLSENPTTKFILQAKKTF
ncbi:LysR family transcriptional regulator [Enterococcus sp. DIV0212c]|uniref:LysR family transcriptional regulator n=1 Tax=Enterococcus sp. DIV0212c TaxID=2230867 RepID=UPI001A9AF141|nr:LysR family transcriptional regulator [Enterococcus sp. DIV0212c]